MTSRPTVLSSVVLAVALLGDSLLYAALPLHARTFGVPLAWVGVLLSANRIVRWFTYPFLPRIAARGLRRFTILAAALAAVSTLVFAAGTGSWTLLASRMVWGVAFGSLSLSTLAYATDGNDGAGRRIGLALSLRELGPLLSLTLGTAAVAIAGIRPTLAALGTLSLVGVLVAMRLPELHVAGSHEGTALFLRPAKEDWLSVTAGFVVDGVFPATIGLMMARSSATGQAIVGASLLLAFKRLAVVLLAPACGHAADRFGVRTVLAGGFGVGAAGAFMLAVSNMMIGALLISCGAALTATAIPVAAATPTDGRVSALARIGMSRDAGAAAGVMAGLLLFDAAGPAVLYSMAGLLLTAAIALTYAAPASSRIAARGIDGAAVNL